LENPAEKGELRIFNQFTETFSVNELAEKTRALGNTLGLGVTIKYVDNPRIEAEEHYYNPAHTGLLELGLKPHYLTEDTLAGMMEFVMKHKDSINSEQIYRKVKWA
jgi:UDP-sulfoquinovose synthase